MTSSNACTTKCICNSSSWIRAQRARISTRAPGRLISDSAGAGGLGASGLGAGELASASGTGSRAAAGSGSGTGSGTGSRIDLAGEGISRGTWRGPERPASRHVGHTRLVIGGLRDRLSITTFAATVLIKQKVALGMLHC